MALQYSSVHRCGVWLVQAETQSGPFQEGPADLRWKLMSFPNESMGSQLQAWISALWSPLSGSMPCFRDIPSFPNDADMFSLGEAFHLLPDSLDDAHSPAVEPVWLLKAQPLQWVSIPRSWGRNREQGWEWKLFPLHPPPAEWCSGSLCYLPHISNIPQQAFILMSEVNILEGKREILPMFSLTDWYPATIVQGFALCAKTWWERCFTSNSESGWILPQDIIFFFLPWTRIYLLESLLALLVNFVLWGEG